MKRIVERSIERMKFGLPNRVGANDEWDSLKQENGWVDWLARAINDKFLRLSKLALVAKQAWFSGHYGRT